MASRKVRGVMVPRPNDCKEIDLPNRIIRWKDAAYTSPECIGIESDPRHLQILFFQFGLGSCNAVTSPAVKPPKGLISGRHLPPSEVTDFRSKCMRLAHIAANRVGISFVSKEIARTMANPTVDVLEAMKRCVRYPKGRPGAVLIYERQPPPSHLTGFLRF